MIEKRRGNGECEDVLGVMNDSLLPSSGPLNHLESSEDDGSRRGGQGHKGSIQ